MTRRPQFLAAAKGAYRAHGAVVVQVLHRQDDDPVVRIGFTATKKIGGAVVRNRAKRRLREAARALLPSFGRPGCDYVFVARDGTPVRDWGQSRNTIAFFVIAILLLFGYQQFVLGPQAKVKKAAQDRAAAEKKLEAPGKPAVPTAKAGNLSRVAAIAESPRVPIATRGHDGKPVLTGSINLTGGQIDDLFLQQYGQTVDKTSPRVDLLRPEATANAFFAEFGWGPANAGLPDATTAWTVKSGQTLTEKTPVVLTYTSPQGLVFDRTIAVDDHYLFTITDTVTNTGGMPVTLQPYSSVRRAGLPPEAGKGQNVHEGAVGWLNKELRLEKYKPWKKKAADGKGDQSWSTTGGWLGITDKYWLAAIIPDQTEKVDARFKQMTTKEGRDYYITGIYGETRSLAPGATVNETTHLFAGAKRAE
eukprot:gene15540-15351_t